MARAMSSLPVPVSPRTRTGEFTAATVLTSSSTAVKFGLDPISPHVDIVPLRLPCPHSLLRNAFADVRRAVSELGAARLALRQQSDGITVDKKQIPQVEGDDTCFRFEEGTKHRHIVRYQLAA